MELTTKTEAYETIDSIYKIHKVSNVKECSSIPGKWSIELYNESINNNLINYLFIVEPHCDAIAHWVYEVAIYLPLYKKLQVNYPSLKLALMTKKNFKTLFFEFFSIPEENICIFDEVPYKYTNLPLNNICLFSHPISHLLLKEVDPMYKIQLTNFIDIINSIPIANIDNNDWLILPRQKKENFSVNDRIIPYDNIFKYFENSKLQYEILNTDDITCIKEQITKLRNYKNIIVPDGGAFSLNILFCSNKNFFVINNYTKKQTLTWPMSTLLMSVLLDINKHMIYYTKDENDFLERYT